MVGDNTEHRVRKSTGALGAPGGAEGCSGAATQPPQGHPTRCIPSAYPGQGFPRQPGGPPEADRLPAPLGVSASPLVAVPSVPFLVLRLQAAPAAGGGAGASVLSEYDLRGTYAWEGRAGRARRGALSEAVRFICLVLGTHIWWRDLWVVET